MKLNLIILNNWIISLLLLLIADASIKLQAASDFQNLYNVMIGNIDITNIGFYPISSLLILAPFAYLLNDIGNFSLFFLVLINSLFFLNLRGFINKKIAVAYLESSLIYRLYYVFFSVYLLVFSSINFFIVKGGLAFLFSLSLLPLFLSLSLNMQFNWRILVFFYTIFLFHPVALSIYLVLSLFLFDKSTLNKIDKKEILFLVLAFCNLIFILGFFYSIFSISYNLIYENQNDTFDYKNVDAFVNISMQMHSESLLLFTLIILIKLFLIYLIPNFLPKLFLFLFCFIYPYFIFLSPYDNNFSNFLKLITIPLQSNIHYFNTIFLFLPFVILFKYLNNHRFE